MLIEDQLQAQLIAFYLPQYHPIVENDEWWGKGFTEWTNVTRAKSLFRGHYQPHLPADLGFYDLRVPETRLAHADLAREYGIYGFCYYDYWFHGKRLLERPLDEIMRSKEPNFPFCLCWANENWTRRWDGGKGEILAEQTYSAEDDLNHIRSLIPVFQDKRYIRVGGKALFLVWRASMFPDSRATTERWREEAARQGVGELFLCRVESHGERGDPRSLGFDAAVQFDPRGEFIHKPLRRSKWWYRARRLGLAEMAYQNHRVLDYGEYVRDALCEPDVSYPRCQCVFPSWDNSARRQKDAFIFINSTPQAYEHWLTAAIQRAKPIGDGTRLVFINAWNEWAEGNHLEPCQRWGRAYLEATRAALQAAGSNRDVDELLYRSVGE